MGREAFADGPPYGIENLAVNFSGRLFNALCENHSRRDNSLSNGSSLKDLEGGNSRNLKRKEKRERVAENSFSLILGAKVD